MTCIEFLCQSNYAENVKKWSSLFCAIFSARIISGYTFIRGAPDPPFPKKSNNPGLNTMKFSCAIGCDYHLWIWTCLIPRPAFRVTWSVCFKRVTEMY